MHSLCSLRTVKTTSSSSPLLFLPFLHILTQLHTSLSLFLPLPPLPLPISSPPLPLPISSPPSPSLSPPLPSLPSPPLLSLPSPFLPSSPFPHLSPLPFPSPPPSPPPKAGLKPIDPAQVLYEALPSEGGSSQTTGHQE